MKKLLVVILAVAALVAVLATCKQVEPTSNKECVESFMDDINNDTGSVYKNLDSSAQKYNEAKTGSYWANYFPTGETFTLSNELEAGSTITGTLTSTATFGGVLITFTMGEDSDDNAVISKINIVGLGDIFY